MNSPKEILTNYYAKAGNGLNAKHAAQELVNYFRTEWSSHRSNSFWKKVSFFSTKPRVQCKRWDMIAQLSREMELFKRSVRRAANYGTLTDLIDEFIKAPLEQESQWGLLTQKIQFLKEELQDHFSSVTTLERKKELKPYLDACHISLAILEERGGDFSLDECLCEEAYAAYRDKSRAYLYNNEELKKSFREHLERIKQWSLQELNTVQVTQEKGQITALQVALKEQLQGAKGGWKLSLCASEKLNVFVHKQFKETILSKYYDRSWPIRVEGRFPSDFFFQKDGGSIAGFCGSTFSGVPRTVLPEEGLILDSTYLIVDGGGISFSGGDGYEHPVSPKRQEQICRVSYFGSKHLARLASRFQRPDKLKEKLLDLFREAAREAAVKSNSVERASGTLIRTFCGNKETVTVVVGSVGDALVFAYEPNRGKVTLMAFPCRYPNGVGGFSPVSFTDQDFTIEQMERGVFNLPLGSFIFYMTDGVWEALDLSLKEEETRQSFVPYFPKLVTFLQHVGEKGLATPLDYKDGLKQRCVDRAEASRQALLDQEDFSVGDDATLVVFQLH